MNSLILDSSAVDLNVGLAINGKIFKTSYPAFQRQAELMIPEIDKLLKANKISPKEINEIIVTVGPGSYTGLRIALTIAKVYSYAVKCPCYAISTLNAMIKKDKPTICLMNARSERSYIGVYKNNECILKDQVFTNEEVKKYIEEHKDYEVSGDLNYLGIESVKPDLIENLFFLHNESNRVKDLLSLKAAYLKD